MAEALSLEGLGLAIRRREVVALRKFITEFRIPEWHPCPCEGGRQAEMLGYAYLERLREGGQKALLPILVIGNYVLTSTCLFETAAKSREDQELLDKVKVEVWSLGDYSDEDRFAVMALAAELCRVHEDKGDREIKLEFAKELIKAYIIDVAVKYGPRQALKIIDELAKGFHTAELAKAFTKYIRVTLQAAWYYIIVLARDEGVINELRQLIAERFGNQPNVGNNAIKPTEAQNSSAVHDQTDRGWFNRELRDSTEERGVRESVEQVFTLKEDSVKRRLAIERLRRFDSNIDDSLLKPLSANDIDRLSRKINELPPGERSELLSKVLTLVREGKIGEAKVMIHGKEQAQEAQAQWTSQEQLTFKCGDEVCNVLRELARESQEGDVKGMLDAALTLASNLANTLGMREYANAIDAVNWGASNPRYIALVNQITELVKESPPTAWAIADEIRAIRDGNLRELCAAFNDLVVTTINNMPKETRETIKGKVKPIECTQYPGPEELGL